MALAKAAKFNEISPAVGVNRGKVDRLGMAIFQFGLAVFMWFLLLGWIIRLWSILDAARFTPRE